MSISIRYVGNLTGRQALPRDAAAPADPPQLNPRFSWRVVHALFYAGQDARSECRAQHAMIDSPTLHRGPLDHDVEER